MEANCNIAISVTHHSSLCYVLNVCSFAKQMPGKAVLVYFYFIFFRGGKGGRIREKHQFVIVVSHAPSTEEVGPNPGICPRLGIKLVTLRFTGQDSTTEPHQPGLPLCVIISPLLFQQDRTSKNNNRSVKQHLNSEKESLFHSLIC